MHLLATDMPGCYEIIPDVLKDERGFFVKTFHRDVFAENGLRCDFAEEYYSFSRKNVLRGLHFQVPPKEHVKIVYCVSGAVLDVVLDLRAGSPTYGRSACFELDSEKANMVYIPEGLAHGFYVRSESALMMYKVTSVYSPEHDTGVLWNSAGIVWPGAEPIISARDRALVPFFEFITPFYYSESANEK